MKRILVIDDEDQVRSMLRMMLEREGYEVEDAENGEVGIRLFRKKPADVVITDILMPEKEGIETIIELRRDFPGAKIIAISGGGRLRSPEIFLKMAKKFGADRIFPKPVERDELLDAVKELANV
ncbi:response regulator transcription factor [Desulfococcaceae bacterium HSG8]|nr:response regulator transcription factor [Desulfococcaceae bacterium HSG8]